MKRRKKNLYFGWGPASKEEQKRQRSYVRPRGVSGVVATKGGARKVYSGEASALRSEVAEALVGQGYKQSEARKRARMARGSDFASLFRSALGAGRNPMRVFPGNLSKQEISALRKLVRTKTMATKKKRRKKKNSKKGVMPPGLRKYWAKKRAKKNPKKRPRAKTRRPRRRKAVRRRKPVSLRVRNYRRPAKARRRRKVNPRPRRTVRIKAPSGLGPKGLQQFRRAIARASGLRTRIVPR
jgi:hypothetical protein